MEDLKPQRSIEADGAWHFMGAQRDRADPFDHGQNSLWLFPAPMTASGGCPQTARTESANALNSPSSWPDIKFQAPTQQDDSSGTREKEQSMNGDPGVIEYLNKALRHELT